MKSSKYNYKLIFSVFAANLLAFATGNAYAWSSTVLTTLKSNDTEINPFGRPATSSEESWIASLIGLGASAGPLLAGYFSDKFGRKNTLLLFAVPMLTSHIILSFATKPIEYYVARFMMGLGVGCVYTVTPVYVGEIAETKIRGLLGCFMAVQQAFGMLLVYGTGPFVSITTLSFILMVPIILFIIFFGFFVPESPYYLIIKNKMKKAEESMFKLRRNSSSKILQEISDMREVVGESDNDQSFTEIIQSRSFRKGITITTVLMICQQLSGITIVLSYMQPIFEATGSSIPASTSTIIVAVIQIIAVISCLFVVDRWGRKILLILASSTQALSTISLAVFFYMKSSGWDVSYLWWLPICCLVAYIVGYNIGLSTVPWALIGELFASNTKAFSSSATTFTCLILSFIMTLIFPSLEQAIGFHGVFCLFTVSSVCCLSFVLWFVPETKGKSFQEILRILEK